MAGWWGAGPDPTKKKSGGSSGKSSSSSSSKSSSSSSSKSSGSSGSSKSSGGSSSGARYNSQGQRLYADGYGGYTTVDPNSSAYTQIYGGGSSAAKPTSGGSSGGSSGSASRPVPGGTSGGSSTNVSYSSGGSTQTSAAGRNYHQEAIDAAARGDWSAVSKALAARQAKINAQGGNDRGTSNAQILAQLQSQYKSSYDRLPSSVQQTVSGMASGSLGGQTANGRGWEDGHDYLAEAQALAKAGDLDAAYDAVLRRGFKLYDTGSTGGGTTQDQAYAQIQQLYNESQRAKDSYQHELERNAQTLAAHPTQFGNVQNPALAGKHFVSQDGQYIIYYDSTGTPVHAQPNHGQYGSTKYTPEYTELMSRYYGGTDDFADVKRQMHNLDVVHSGNGRLIDQDGSFASGESAPVTSWADWDPAAVSTRNTGQDSDALRAILAQINAGQTSGGSVAVPSSSATGTSLLNRPGTTGVPNYRAPSYSEDYTGGAGAADAAGLTDYLQAMYKANLEAQLAQLRASYEANQADIQAQDDLIARNYQDQRNQAAGQNDLNRLSMLEMGAASGLNTGASGQMALAQSMAYQNALAQLGAAENQDLSANALERSKLASSYRGAVDSASAANTASMSEALYNELVRQIQAETAAQQAALAQSNWERQFAYQQAQDALSQQNWQTQFDYQKALDELSQRNWQAQQDYAAAQDAASLEYQYQKLLSDAEAKAGGTAADWAKLYLQNGVMPDAGTLSAVGLDPASAQALADSYRRQLAAKGSTRSGGGGGTSGGTGGGTPRMTLAQAISAIEDGRVSDNAIAAYDYYNGSGSYQRHYGQDGGSTGSVGNTAWPSSLGTLTYDSASGQFNWNGQNYTMDGLVRAANAGGLSDSQLLALQNRIQQISGAGIDMK